MAAIAEDVEVLEDSLAELLAKEAEVIDKWQSALDSVHRIENLCMQAEYDFWTASTIPMMESESCPLLGCAYEQSAAVLLNNTTTPISFAYMYRVLKLARDEMVNWGSQYEGEKALKILQDPYTRLPIMQVKVVRVLDTSGVEIVD